MSFLERQIAISRKQGNPRYADTLALLISPNPDAIKIREWFQKHARTGISKTWRNTEDNSDREDWEAELWFFAYRFADFFPMDTWERASADDRKQHSRNVAKLARKLADALEEEVSPYYPPVLEFFDPERAVDIIRALPEETSKALLLGTGYSHDWRAGYERSKKPAYLLEGTPQWLEPPRALSSRFGYPKPQAFPSLLRRLAEYSERQTEKPKRDNRPTIQNADARAFARHIAEYFRMFFERTPNEVIAACVALKYPDLDSPPDEGAIRNWLGTR